MSDPQYGEPVEETSGADNALPVDDVVGRANEGLADAEAASREAVDAPSAPEDAAVAASSDTPATEWVHDPAYDDLDDDGSLDYMKTSAAAPAVSSEPLYRPEVAAADAATDAPTAAYATPDVTATTAYPETVTPSEPVAPVAPVVPTPQPIFVQAPEAPRPRGNRGAAGLIGILAALVFGVLYLAAALGFRAIDGGVTLANIGTEALAALTSAWFWVPVAIFFIGFWLLGAIINRGRWGHWVIFGLLVGAIAYGGHILGQLFQAPFWSLTASQGAELVQGQLLAPLAIAAFIIGREVTIWFGAWVAGRGARMTELNNEAQREYERTLEAGPRLHG